ncbi:DNA excision repair protein ERCC-6-like [Branchiostoma floridae x Branchiostoma belcheri]
MSISSTADAVGRMRLDDGGAKSSGLGMPDASSKALFNKLIMRAKQEQEKGNLQKALQKYREAQKLYPTDKVLKKIKKIEAYLLLSDEEEEEEEVDDGTVCVSEGFNLPKDVYDKLYPYQQEAVKWFYSLFTKRKGGILGDDMGLGKTVQVTAFLYGMFLMDHIKNVLIILPVALITNWERELEKWASGEIRVKQFHGSNARERTRNLERVQRRGGVVLTSYGMVSNNWEQLAKIDYKEFVWDYVILDEGHKIKNPTKTTKACHAIPARNRFILTGTPIQNNLREMWALFDFVSQGTLLGTAKTFKMEYENPITRAREKDATAGEIHLGNRMSESLRQLIAPYFLRRTKAEVMPKDKENTDPNQDAGEAQEQASGNTFPSLERKNDLILWVILSKAQQQIYKDFLSLDRVKEMLMTTRSPLAELNVLKKICDHPRLLSTLACAQLGLDGEDGLDPEDEDNMAHEVAANSIENISSDQLMAESGKTCVLVELLERLKEEGHQTLVFSQSRKMLDIIQKILKSRGFKVMRIDGTITKLEDRDKRIRRFQSDPSWSVFLLTTQVGGVGLNLTAADRVIIYDPSWNPATDAQAVDRAYRIGQQKSVVIYRFITCGSVEEKIYRRQVFKESVTRQTTGACKDPFRYFSRQDLRELFVMDNPEHSTTQEQLAQMHSQNRKSDTALDEHIAYLHSLGIFGISDHDLLYSKQADHEELPAGQEYIQQRVHKARELVMAESQLHHQMNELRQTTTEASFLRRHGGKQLGPEPGPSGSQDGFPDNLPELFHPSQDHNPRNMLNKPKVRTVSSDDYTDSPVHPKSHPDELPGRFIDLSQETEEEQAQQLEKSFAKISISSQEREEEEQEQINSSAEADQEDHNDDQEDHDDDQEDDHDDEDEQLQLALAMSLQENPKKTLTREPLTDMLNISRKKYEGDISKQSSLYMEDNSIVSVDDDRATPGLNNALFTSSDSLQFVADSGDEDTSRGQPSSRSSSRPFSRGDVFVIEDSEPEEAGSDDDVPVVSAAGFAQDAIIDVSEEEEEIVDDFESESLRDRNTVERKEEMTAAVPHIDSREGGTEDEDDTKRHQDDVDISDDSAEESEVTDNSRQSDRKSFPSVPGGHNRLSLDNSLIKNAQRRPRPRVIDSDSEDDGDGSRDESRSEHHRSLDQTDSPPADNRESFEEGKLNNSSVVGSEEEEKDEQEEEVAEDDNHIEEDDNSDPGDVSEEEEDEQEKEVAEEDSHFDEENSDPGEAETDDDDDDEASESDQEGSLDEEQEEEEVESEMEEEYYSPEEDSLHDKDASHPDLMYRELVKEGRKLEAEGDLNSALNHYLQALDMDGSDLDLQTSALKLTQKIHTA